MKCLNQKKEVFEEFEMVAQADFPILKVKARIIKKRNANEDDFTLLAAGKIMEEYATLRDYGVMPSKNTFIFMVGLETLLLEEIAFGG